MVDEMDEASRKENDEIHGGPAGEDDRGPHPQLNTFLFPPRNE